MRDAWSRLSAFPFVPLLLAGAVIGLVVMALMWWTTSEA
jgi:prepilin signal peptidase PulO-like enzyme (type II secretory pathway)